MKATIQGLNKKIAALVGSLTIASVNTALPAEAATYRFDLKVVNNSSAAVDKFCISGSYDDTYMCISDWRRLYSGYYQNVWVSVPVATCYFDYKAVFSDGYVLERHSVNLCKTGQVTFYD